MDTMQSRTTTELDSTPAIPSVTEIRLPANVNAGGSVTTTDLDAPATTIVDGGKTGKGKGKGKGKAQGKTGNVRTSTSHDAGRTWQYQPVTDSLDFRPSAYGKRADRRMVKAQCADVAKVLKVSHTFKNDGGLVLHIPKSEHGKETQARAFVMTALPQGWTISHVKNETRGSEPVFAIYVHTHAAGIMASQARSRFTRHAYSTLTDKDYQNNDK